MYNSIIINVIMAVVIRVQSLYRYSLAHRLLSYIKGLGSRIWNGSLLVIGLKRLGEYYENSFISTGTKKLAGIMTRILQFLNRLSDKILKGSELSYGVDYYTRDLNGISEFVSTVLIVSAVVMEIFILTGNLVISRYISPAAAVIGILGLIMTNRDINILSGSLLCSWIDNLYTLDTGDNQWW